MSEVELSEKQEEQLLDWVKDHPKAGTSVEPCKEDDRRTLNALVKRGLMEKDEDPDFPTCYILTKEGAKRGKELMEKDKNA